MPAVAATVIAATMPMATATLVARGEFTTVVPTVGSVPPVATARESGDSARASAEADMPAAWMVPAIRSTHTLAFWGANGRSADASSATFG
jgi:hypothetical protein